MMAERYNNPPISSPHMDSGSQMSPYSARSPLELVRKNSRKALAASQAQSNPMNFQSRTYAPPPSSRNPPPDPIMVPPHPNYYQSHSPDSPLLHSSFGLNHDSSMAASTLNDTSSSYIDLSRDSVDWQNVDPPNNWARNTGQPAGAGARGFEQGGPSDDASIYSRASAMLPQEPALRDSWNTGPGTPRAQYFANNQPQIPSFVVTDDDDATHGSSSTAAPTLKSQQMAHRAPIVRSLSNSSHYSMPMRAAAMASAEEEEERKRAVLARHGRSPSPSGLWGNPQSPSEQPSPRFSSPYQSSSRSPSPYQDPPRSSSPYQPPHSPSIYQGPPRSPSPGNIPRNNPSLHSQSAVMPDSSSSLTVNSHLPEPVALPRRPPSLRAGSPTSVYDRYSYYELGSPVSPDRDQQQQQQQQQHRPGVSSQSSSNLLRVPSPLGTESASSPNEGEPNLANPTTAWDFLHLGINAHLASKSSGPPPSPSRKSPRKTSFTVDTDESLRQSALYFEKSATVSGGCTMGMLMWGLALRHGWGVRQNEKEGFSWLRRAAEGALGHAIGEDNLQEKTEMISQKGLNPDIQSQLVVAIYEVGQCFFQGWGVPKDKAMAVSYYRTAARLGDADAQNDLAFCLANGKGCKKDRKEAAKWYRAAVAQGQSDVGLAWIYKEKFQD